LEFEVTGPIWYWRGPAPFYFLSVPEYWSKELKGILGLITYGWGMIPVTARIGKTEFTTSMFHKDGLYVLPVKDAVRRAENIQEDDEITATIIVKLRE
jgi:hypothetical protein